MTKLSEQQKAFLTQAIFQKLGQRPRPQGDEACEVIYKSHVD